jgi:cytochrome P450
MLTHTGTDTSSVAISAFFFYLSRYPEAYERLATEVRNEFANAEEIRSGPNLKNCTYLRACIDESMRLAPPVGAPLWREMRDQGAVAGAILPKRVNVATCIYSVQRNPAYFADPNEFKPERWLPDSESDDRAELAKKAFVPFSLGSRGCIGKNLAYLELTTMLAQIVYRADWKVADGALGKVGEIYTGERGVVDFELKGHFTSGKSGPFIQFMPRIPGAN